MKSQRNRRGMPRLNLGVWTGLAFLAAFALAGPWMVRHASGQQSDMRRPVPISADSETVGEPWIGEMGVTESVDEIMARERANPFVWDGKPRVPEPNFEDEDGEDGEGEPLVDRSGLPQNP